VGKSLFRTKRADKSLRNHGDSCIVRVKFAEEVPVDRSREAILRQRLLRRKEELMDRLERVTANLRRTLEADSAERAKQLEDREVVEQLGNDARAELAHIAAALRRMDSGAFGVCAECSADIDDARLEALPYARYCIDCADV
jgi:RNA polymerase-binding protein DksA